MNHLHRLVVVVVSLELSAAVAAPCRAADLTVDQLQCECRVDPLGVEAARPRLSWVLHSAERGQRQTAYRVLAASSPELLAKDQGDLWDSGKVVSDRSTFVPYAGKALKSRAQCHWKVSVWGKAGRRSAWSQPAQWTMGLLTPDDWHGQWIGASAPLPLCAASSESASRSVAPNSTFAGWVSMNCI